MKIIRLVLITLLAHPFLYAADTQWEVVSSKLDYHADHTFHNTVGTSTAAKGKGACGANGCDFLVAAPIKSFDSGDANRDLHMLQAVKGGANPLVSVRIHLDKEPVAGEVKGDLTIDLAGKSALYPGVAFNVVHKTADQFQVKGVVPLQLTRHDVERPSLLGVAVKDSAPVDIVVDWKKAGK